MRDVLAIIDDVVPHPDIGEWLKANGVPVAELTARDLVPLFDYVIFDEWNRSFFFDEGGRPAIIFAPPPDDQPSAPTDLVAFECERPWVFGTYTGELFALGQGEIDNPTTYFKGRALRLHRTPFDWLRAGGGGAVLVDDEAWSIRSWFAAPTVNQRITVDCPDLEYGKWLRSQFADASSAPLIRVPITENAS